MAAFFPELHKIGNENENVGTLNRIVCKITFRSSVATLRSDINGLDFYTVS